MEIYLLTSLCLVLSFAVLYYRGQRVDPKIKEDYDYFVGATGWTKGKSIGAELIHSRRYVEALESRCGALSEAIKIAIDREVDLENRLSQALSERDEQKRAYEDLHAEATRTASEVLQIGDPVYTGGSEVPIGFATETVGADETVNISLTHHATGRPQNYGGSVIYFPNGETLDLRKPVRLTGNQSRPLRNAETGQLVHSFHSEKCGESFRYDVWLSSLAAEPGIISSCQMFDVPV